VPAFDEWPLTAQRGRPRAFTESDARPVDREELPPVDERKNLGRSRFLRQVYHRRPRELLLMAAGISNARSLDPLDTNLP
jgi:hypothetical protein